jgi:hypothetical protein
MRQVASCKRRGVTAVCAAIPAGDAPEVITQVLGILYRAISGHLICKAGLTRATAVM